MPHVANGDVNIYYEDHGSGPAVLLSHGFSATSLMWKDQIEALKDRYRVIVWDMRGHGQSDSPDDPALYSEASTIEDMAALLDACEVESGVIGGLSLGGYMSLAFHRVYPHRVDALMLFDTGPGYRNAEARAQWNARAEEWATSFEKIGLDTLATMGSNEMRAKQHRSAQGLAHAARGMLAQVDSNVLESLPTVNVPTLVLVGEKDAPFLPPTEYMSQKIPNAQKVVIPNAGHSANLDNPGAFNDAVLSFLASL